MWIAKCEAKAASIYYSVNIIISSRGLCGYNHYTSLARVSQWHHSHHSITQGVGTLEYSGKEQIPGDTLAWMVSFKIMWCSLLTPGCCVGTGTVLSMLCIPGGINSKLRQNTNVWDSFKSGILTKLISHSLSGLRGTILIPTQKFGTQAPCDKDAQVMPVPRDSFPSLGPTSWLHGTNSKKNSSPSASPHESWNVLSPLIASVSLHSYLVGDPGKELF